MSAVEDKPVAPVEEVAPVVAEPAPVVETKTEEATAEAKTEEPVATSTEAKTEEPAVETKPEEATEAKADETPEAKAEEETVEPSPVTEGLAKYKGPGFLSSFLGKNKYFYLGGSESVEADKFKHAFASVKEDVSKPIIAWASVTAEGILFGAHDKEGPIEHAFLLADVTIASVKDKSFTLTSASGKKTYTFVFESKSLRDGWVAGLNAAKKAAEDKQETIKADPKYQEAIKVPEPVAEEKKEEETAKPAEETAVAETSEAPAATEEAVATEDKPASAEGEKTEAAETSPATKNKRLSVFGTLTSKLRRPSGEAKSPKEVTEEAPVAEQTTEEPAATTEAAPLATEGATATTEETPAATTEEPATKDAEDAEKAAKVTRRRTFLDYFKKPKAAEGDKEAETTEAPATEAPAEASTDAPAADATEPAAPPAEEPAEATTSEGGNVVDTAKKSIWKALKSKSSKPKVASADKADGKEPSKRLSLNLFRHPKPNGETTTEATEPAATTTETTETAPQVDVPVTEEPAASTEAAVTKAADEAALEKKDEEATPADVAAATPAPEAEKPATTA